MTSVYGVTFLGARKQIEGQLKVCSDSFSMIKIGSYSHRQAGYFWRHALQIIHLFGKIDLGVFGWDQPRSCSDYELVEWSSGKGMWLCIQLILQVAHENQPMAWVTPLGLPIIQPYRKTKTFNILTSKQNLTLKLEMYVVGVGKRRNRDSQPVKTTRQRTAFPPNFVYLSIVVRWRKIDSFIG